MTKRIIAILLAVMLCVALIACSNQPTTQPSTKFSESIMSELTDATSSNNEKDTDDGNSTVHSEKPTTDSTSSVTESTITAEKEDAESTPTETTTPPRQTETTTVKDTAEPTAPSDTEVSTPKEDETTEPTVTEPSETHPPETKPTETKPTETKPAQTEPKPTEPAETEPQGFTKADHDRIIAEVKAYAESYTAKGYTYIWKAGMEFSEDVGYMGTPRIKRDGVDGVIRTLKHHIDLIYKTTTDPSNGITCDEMTYRVMQIDLDGEIAFVVVYGG